MKVPWWDGEAEGLLSLTFLSAACSSLCRPLTSWLWPVFSRETTPSLERSSSASSSSKRSACCSFSPWGMTQG